MLGENHHNQVNQPNNPATEDNAEDSRYDFAFLESGNEAANPRRNGDNRQNQAYDVAEPEIISSFCHFKTLL